jgi:hypothetical protein
LFVAATVMLQRDGVGRSAPIGAQVARKFRADHLGHSRECSCDLAVVPFGGLPQSLSQTFAQATTTCLLTSEQFCSRASGKFFSAFPSCQQQAFPVPSPEFDARANKSFTRAPNVGLLEVIAQPPRQYPAATFSPATVGACESCTKLHKKVASTLLAYMHGYSHASFAHIARILTSSSTLA